MPLVSFGDLMTAAGEGNYAVGYFECWDMASLMAVADAAKATRSPVLLGFSGIYLTHPGRVVTEPLGVYATLGQAVCQALPVPAGLIYNESPDLVSVYKAIDLGFSLVMFSDEDLDPPVQRERVGQVVEIAHGRGIAVEGEVEPLANVGGALSGANDETRLTESREAAAFVEETGVDALAVNLGQMHLHGRQALSLDLKRLGQLAERVQAPLVLHGASSIRRDDLRAAIDLGVRKINVSSLLKQAYFGALRETCAAAGESANPYEVIGSGLKEDVLVAARLAMQEVVMELIDLFGSAGKA
jgi:fructose/tagatose bisphosphate aldolase